MAPNHPRPGRRFPLCRASGAGSAKPPDAPSQRARLQAGLHEGGPAQADGVSRRGVISSAGALVRGRGITSVAKPGTGIYQVVLDADVRGCTYFATSSSS